MKLYYHPASTTCRPIMQFAAEAGLRLDYELVDLMTGQQRQPAYAEINPSQTVPALVDGDLRLGESSAILKYLAEHADSPAYPSAPQQRAQINALMDWFNTGLSRDLGYGLVYPQIFPTHRRTDPACQQGTLEWGRTKAKHWLGILDTRLLGPERHWLVGDRHTLADYFGAAFVTLGEIIRLDYARYPNVQRWLGNVKALPAWDQANAVFYQHVVANFRDGDYVGL